MDLVFISKLGEMIKANQNYLHYKPIVRFTMLHFIV